MRRPLVFPLLFLFQLLFQLLFLLGVASTIACAQQYDLVLEGGRVIDPETRLDAIRNVGIRDGKIVRITGEPLSGRRMIHAAGLVVAPGFIDLHQHAQGLASQHVKAFDGVTTALEMEIGARDVTEFLKSKQGNSLIHYGTTASYVAARALAFGAPLSEGTILPKSGFATDQAATPEQIQQIQQRLRDQLDAGALGVGMGIEYVPGASRLEVIDMFRVAAERKLPVYTHMRSAGRVDPGSAIQSTEEVIGAAAITGASLHIVHINSTCLRDSLECLSMIEGARARGLDITTEAYPYIAGMTAINSAVFNPRMARKTGHRLQQSRSSRHWRAPHQRALRRTAQLQQATVGADLLQHAASCRRHHSQPAGYDRERRTRKPSPQRWHLLARHRAICSREKDAHAHGSSPQDDADAGADAGTFDARRAA
jgi:hypothetical protein